MINVKKTIYASIVNSFNRLMKLADNNPIAFKKILFLIILDDLFDWADYLDQPQSVQAKLKQLRYDFIDQNREFIKQYDVREFDSYVNVNTPQTNSTWKRVYDTTVSDFDVDQVTKKNQFDPVPSVTPETFTFPYTSDNGVFIESENITLTIDQINNLTDIEKMSYYVDPETDVAYKLDPVTCEWVRMLMDDDTKQSIIDEITSSFNGINVAVVGDTDKKLRFTIAANGDNEIDIADSDDLNDII